MPGTVDLFDPADADVVIETVAGADPTGIVVHATAGSADGVGTAITWEVRNERGDDVGLWRVGLRWRIPVRSTPVPAFLHGWQSWSRSRVAAVGVDDDPSRHEYSMEIGRNMYCCDKRVSPPGELRAESCCIVDTGNGLCSVSADAADRHDTTFRLWLDGDTLMLQAEAWLGGAVLPAQAARGLHRIVAEAGDDAGVLFDRWALRVAAANDCRPHAPYQVGWCSWYQYFHDVTDADLRANLAVASADGWPFDVFQLDDGYQRAIGDWTRTNDKFARPIEAIATEITAAGYTPGLWIAPFMATPDSAVYADHPDWMVALDPDRSFAEMRAVAGDGPAWVHVNPGWGGTTFALDTSHPEVLDHLESVAADLVAAGYPYLKLDFTYAPTLHGAYHDPTQTPAERVRAGYAAIRRGAGASTFLLGCGAPLLPAAGLVDGMRIGPDVAPHWPEPVLHFPGFAEEAPSVANAWRNTLTRSVLHRRLWLNDPDCLMLRTTGTELSVAAVDAWAAAVACSGGMALVSDDLALLDAESRRRLDDVVAVGRAVDAAAVAGRPPVCADLMTARLPAELGGPAARLDADPVAATGRVIVAGGE